MKRLQLLLLQGVMLQWCYFLCYLLCSSTVESSPLGGQGAHRTTSCYYYERNTSTCQECSVCSQGEGTLQQCTNTTNTVCTQCKAHDMLYTFNAAMGSWECQNCTNCSQTHRLERVACNETANSVCGRCLKGYFLGVGRGGLTLCMRCSRCPPDGDRRVVRWRDCQEAGLDRKMWCSPGYVDPGTTTVATEQLLQNTESAARSPSLVTVATMPTTNTTCNYSVLYVGDHHSLSVPSDSRGADGKSPSSVLVVGAVSCFSLALLMCILIGGVLACLKRNKKVCNTTGSSTKVPMVGGLV